MVMVLISRFSSRIIFIVSRISDTLSIFLFYLSNVVHGVEDVLVHGVDYQTRGLADYVKAVYKV